MRRALGIAVSVLAWGCIVAYLVWARNVSDQGESARIFRALDIRVLDSARLGVITPAMVRLWIENEGITLKNMPVRDINTLAIERLAERRGYVRDASVWADMSGVIHITLTQRHPMMRVVTGWSPDDYNFYVTDDGWILPLQNHASSYVPVVSGYIPLPFPKGYAGRLEDIGADNKKKFAENYGFIRKLTNFVSYIEGNSFWRAMFVQISVTGGSAPGSLPEWHEPEIELVSRVGDQVILLGTLDGYEEKLSKLQLFYRKAIPAEGWGAEKVINLKYRGQIVCTR